MSLFFNNWLNYANKIELDIFTINKVKSLLFLCFEKFTKCTTNNEKSKIIKKFLNDHPENLFLLVDKTKNLAYVRIEDYLMENSI
jgi:hypothetical protein